MPKVKLSRVQEILIESLVLIHQIQSLDGVANFTSVSSAPAPTNRRVPLRQRKKLPKLILIKGGKDGLDLED